MPDQDESVYRLRHRATGDEVSVRNAEEVDDGEEMMEVRMPIATTGEVRNEGDDPLTRDELRGMARQLSDREIGVFPAHGDDTMIAAGRYSPFEKLGVWTDGEIDAREDTNLLMATARMPDPETLPEATGSYRQALAILKEQAQRGIAQDASIGWRSDTDGPGGVDLMEASIVGIGADPRTNTGDDAAEVVAREAVAAGADPDDLVARVADAVATRAEYEVGETTVDITPPEYMADAADLAMQKAGEGLGSDCGTGVGDERADQIRADEVGPDVVVEIASYLTSHEEDVTADGSPSEWSDEEWDDCGNIQYAKWGGDGSGDALAWAQERANAVAEARDEEVPYPSRNLDDPEFSEGDAVSWDWQGDTVHGRVADVGDEFTVGGTTITGADGEAVYLIHEWDEEVEAFRRANVAKPQSSLSESGMDMPAATEENFQDMTDDDTGDEPGTTDEQDAPGDGSEVTERAPDDLTEDRLATFAAVHYDGMDEGDIMALAEEQGAEFTGTTDVEELYDLVSVVTGAEYDAVESAMSDLVDTNEMGDDEDDEEDEDDAEDDDEEQSADPDDGDDAGRDLADEVAALREEVDDLREGGLSADDVETPDPDAEQSADDGDGDEEDRDATDDDTVATAGPNWRAN